MASPSVQQSMKNSLHVAPYRFNNHDDKRIYTDNKNRKSTNIWIPASVGRSTILLKGALCNFL